MKKSYQWSILGENVNIISIQRFHINVRLERDDLDKLVSSMTYRIYFCWNYFKRSWTLLIEVLKKFRASGHCLICLTKQVIHWKPVNVITDNVISRLVWSCLLNYNRLYCIIIIAHCYCLVNVINSSWSQSDHIKRLPPH